MAEELTFAIKLSDLVRDLGGFPLAGTRFRHEEAQWQIVSVLVRVGALMVRRSPAVSSATNRVISLAHSDAPLASASAARNGIFRIAQG